MFQLSDKNDNRFTNPANICSAYSVKVWQVVDCRSWQPVNYVSMTDRPDQTEGMTLAEREGAQNRLEGWKQVRVGTRTVWRDGNS